MGDLLPLNGVAVSLPGNLIPYRISERLHAAIKVEANNQAVPLTAVLRDLREELGAR